MLDIREDIQDKPDFSGMPFRLILHLLDPEEERNIGRCAKQKKPDASSEASGLFRLDKRNLLASGGFCLRSNGWPGYFW